MEDNRRGGGRGGGAPIAGELFLNKAAAAATLPTEFDTAADVDS